MSDGLPGSGEGEIGATRVLTPDGWVGPAVIEVAEGRIVAIRPTTADQPDRTIVPGFIDVQVNGIGADDVSAEDADWARLNAHLLAQGVTTWCPTVVTSAIETYQPVLARIAALDRRDRHGPIPDMAGVHLEGPFLGGAPGAHRRDLICPVDLDFIRGLPPVVRIMTLAPEIAHAGEAIVALVEHGVLPALGHSTATFDQSVAAAHAGARLVTHLFNGMAGMHHREPGLAGAALADPRLTPSIIADNVHVHPAALATAFRASQGSGPILVTDAVAWRSARLGRQTIEHRDGAPRLRDGTLAGSDLTMDQAIRNVVAAGVPLEAAVTAATSTPAHLLGLHDRGVLAPGRRADLVAFRPDLTIEQAWLGGIAE
ncbi:MAG: N-acetylglucosamine-6-phosphate deacetylase [Acidimicrobiales bacterium]